MDYSLTSPFPEMDLPRVWAWAYDLRERLFDDSSPLDEVAFTERVAVGIAGGDTSWLLAVNGEPAGIILARETVPGIVDVSWVIKRKHWSAAVVTYLSEVFGAIFAADEGIRKITSQAFKDNHTVFETVRKLGGIKEGTLRAHTTRGGIPADVVIFGILREDFTVAMKWREKRKVVEENGTICDSGDHEYSGRAGGTVREPREGAHHDNGPDQFQRLNERVQHQPDTAA